VGRRSFDAARENARKRAANSRHPRRLIVMWYLCMQRRLVMKMEKNSRHDGYASPFHVNQNFYLSDQFVKSPAIRSHAWLNADIWSVSKFV